MLKKQLGRLKDRGFECRCATELEFFCFEKSFDQLRKENYQKLDDAVISGYNDDYAILQTTKEEFVMREIRNGLYEAGVPVEGTKGEAEAGQVELNITYTEAQSAANHHTIAKHAVKEISFLNKVSTTFLAKWSHDRVGSASHVHLSLWKDDDPAFFDPLKKFGMSKTMSHFVAGCIQYLPDLTVFFAPYVNSYKRFAKGTFAPTKGVWAVDNRTAAFRLCGADSPKIRIECRVPGADCNPYLAIAGLVAAGVQGIDDNLDLGDPVNSNAYDLESGTTIPTTLRDAIPLFRTSSLLRSAMGSDVVDHYSRAAEIEQDAFDRVVTDYEIRRGFERA